MEDLKSSSWPWKDNLWHKIKKKKNSPNDFYHFQKERKEGGQRKRKE